MVLYFQFREEKTMKKCSGCFQMSERLQDGAADGSLAEMLSSSFDVFLLFSVTCCEFHTQGTRF